MYLFSLFLPYFLSLYCFRLLSFNRTYVCFSLLPDFLFPFPRRPRAPVSPPHRSFAPLFGRPRHANSPLEWIRFLLLQVRDISASGKLAAISTQFSGSLIINNIYRDCLTILGLSFPFLKYFLSHLQTSQALHFVFRLILFWKWNQISCAISYPHPPSRSVFQEGITSLIPFIHNYGQAFAAR